MKKDHPWSKKTSSKKMKRIFFMTGENTIWSKSNVDKKHLRGFVKRQLEENESIRNGTKSEPIISIDI